MRIKPTVLAAIIAALMIVPAAQAKSGQYTAFSSATAFNGAHAWAGANLDAVPAGVTAVDCIPEHPSFVPRPQAVRWLCAVDTYASGTSTKSKQHALIQVLRLNGAYVYRPITL